ncbi:CLUMA_CG001643, isoform A [Clunio marinus]|uniref:CLUMA_CG001643, isoform A n=1 Tax=Clunio marinus TaxID=568069 RepID=A0A1J1HIH7_9DIPT|nr:CLUMA_CG001643, isoform A [Clunio marinus]
MKVLSVFMMLVFGTFGGNLQHYDRELSTIKLLYYSPTITWYDDPIEITREWKYVGDISPSRKYLKLLIHGWNADSDHVALETVKNSYMKINTSHLLMADWREIASMRYITARELIPLIGKQICQLLRKFVEQALIGPDRMHIIGHSLGAHIATHVGRCFNGEISRMTALDPAGPLFNSISVDALNKNDFKFVDSIHTSAGFAGEFEMRSHADFYPNDGKAPQPGCELLDVLTLSGCSHFRAPLYFSESILIPQSFNAFKCDLLFIKSQTCLNFFNASDMIVMGEQIDKRISGSFYLESFSTFPYGKSSYPAIKEV